MSLRRATAFAVALLFVPSVASADIPVIDYASFVKAAATEVNTRTLLNSALTSAKQQAIQWAQMKIWNVASKNDQVWSAIAPQMQQLGEYLDQMLTLDDQAAGNAASEASGSTNPEQAAKTAQTVAQANANTKAAVLKIAKLLKIQNVHSASDMANVLKNASSIQTTDSRAQVAKSAAAISSVLASQNERLYQLAVARETLDIQQYNEQQARRKDSDLREAAQRCALVSLARLAGRDTSGVCPQPGASPSP